MLQFKTDDPFAKPEDAARELIRLCKREMETTGQPHAYTGTVNNAFTYGGGSTVASYGAGRDYAIAKGWLIIDISGTRFTVTPEGEDA
jgi:hypothetical protein